MKKYITVYNYYKELILTNQLKSGDKMPSLRNATAIMNVSQTTIENAYFELQADGYIIAHPKSGYFVSDIKRDSESLNIKEKETDNIKYDLKSGDADEESFDLALWQRYIKSALRQKERLLSYGCPEGEEDLRIALSDYIREKRNVTASPDRIIVGAGVQALLNILCAITKDRQTVSFPTEGFNQGITLFENYGYSVSVRNKDADIIYVSPSHMTSYGDIMPIKRRLELIEYSKEKNSLIIEDDFDSDFLYQTKPTPSLYALSGNENVIYMGSFSNVLIPGIRISFMVLTKELEKRFRLMRDNFAQTASKTEQIALCGYIRDGHIASQTRKIRRHYTAKTRLLYDELKRSMPKLKCDISKNGLSVRIKCSKELSEKDFESAGLAVSVQKDELVLIPSALSKALIPEAVEALRSVIE
ncbi:MAG: PLP-dependent aminotransferase family protein [Eubacterium sp.]|nr:PLP-dependent aminotransferase family protein [Eubacterium sp.]